MAFHFKQALNALLGVAPPGREVETKSAPQVERKSASWLTGGGDIASEASYKNFYEVAKKAFEQNVVGFRCTSTIANAIGAIPWYLKQNDKEVEKHPLLILINKPNKLQGRGSFFAHAAGSLVLDGNLFIEGVGTVKDRLSRKAPPKELWVLRPDHVDVNHSISRLPVSYTYTPGTLGAGGREVYTVDQTTGECRLLHVMSYSPLFETESGRGFSPLKSVWLSLLTHTEGQRWNYSLIENGARPSGAFVTGNGPGGVPTNLSDEQYARLQQQIAESYVGAKNAGKHMVLEGGLDYKEMGLSPKDMDFLNGKNSSARDVALALGVPPMLLGIPGDNTYSNYQEARLAFYEDTVLPLAYQLASELNRWLVPYFGDDLQLCIDEDAIVALEPKREQKFTRANAATFLSVNERREMVGYDKIGPEGDAILVPTSVLPLGADIDDTEVAPAEEPESKPADEPADDETDE